MFSGYRAPCTLIFEAALSISRRSTNVPVAAASQTLLSHIVKSLTLMASPTQTNDKPNSPPFLVRVTLDEKRHYIVGLNRLTRKATLVRFVDSRERNDSLRCIIHRYLAFFYTVVISLTG
jgi:hypothetical protein